MCHLKEESLKEESLKEERAKEEKVTIPFTMGGQ